MRRLIREVFEKHEKRRLGSLIDNRYKNVVLALFEEAHEQAKRNVYTLIFEVMEQAIMRAFFIGGADVLLHENM